MSITKKDSLDMSPSDVGARPDGAAPGAASAAGANRSESHTLVRADSADARHTLIAEAAYHRAQQRGFVAGGDWQDWFEAEREVDTLLDSDL